LFADKKFTAATLANLKGKPVLTAEESEDFVQEGGHDWLLSLGQPASKSISLQRSTPN